MDKIEEGKWNAELRVIVVKQIREGIRRELDKVSDVIKGMQDELTKLRGVKPLDGPKINEMQDTMHKYELDADKMKEQMMGKYIESEEEYRGGLDEEIKNIEQQIAGGEEFRKVIAIEMKKL